jgi:hypothetical protein
VLEVIQLNYVLVWIHRYVPCSIVISMRSQPSPGG